MKKLLILPVVLGLTACDRPNETIELKCASDDIYKPYNDTVLKVYDDYVVIRSESGSNFRIPFTLDNAKGRSYSNFDFYNPELVLRIGLEYNNIKFVTHNNEECDVIVPMDTHFDADCVGIKVSGQINQDYAVVSFNGGKEVRLQLSRKNTIEDENTDSYFFEESENGWALSVFAEMDKDKIYQISIAEPNKRPSYNGCNVLIPLN